jgi:hypothetical protein
VRCLGFVDVGDMNGIRNGTKWCELSHVYEENKINGAKSDNKKKNV